MCKHIGYTICPRRSDPFYIKWVTTSWTYNIPNMFTHLYTRMGIHFPFILVVQYNVHKFLRWTLEIVSLYGGHSLKIGHNLMDTPISQGIRGKFPIQGSVPRTKGYI